MIQSKHIEVVLCALLFMGCIACNNTNSRYKEFTPERIVEGSGIVLPLYILKKDINDRNLVEDGWGQQGWLLELATTIDNNVLDSLVRDDDRWYFQDDVRQQYYFYEKVSITESREIYIGKDNDPIISVCYSWKK